MLTMGVAAVLQEGPERGSLLWWAALIGIVGILGAGVWRILTAGGKLVRFLANIETTLNRLTDSVNTLTASDAKRTEINTTVVGQVDSLSRALSGISEIATARYEKHDQMLFEHDDRLTQIEHVPIIRRTIK